MNQTTISTEERQAVERAVELISEAANLIRAWDWSVPAAELDGIAQELSEEVAER